MSEPAHLTLVSAALTLIATFPNRSSIPLLPSFNDPKYSTASPTTAPPNFSLISSSGNSLISFLPTT